jgi:hypothetical protein
MTDRRHRTPRWFPALLPWAALGFVACMGVPAPAPSASPPDASGAAGDSSFDSGSAVPRCRPGTGASSRPATIDETVRLVNSLPRPVTITCLLESLERPLGAVATYSTISLQPAAGLRSPRVFLLTDKLVMSVVVDGKGRDLLELGEYVAETRTLKGEIAFPATAAVPAGEPYRRIRSDTASTGANGTSCRFCHPAEEPGPEVDGAVGYISGALKPGRRTLVPLDDVRREHQTCDPAVEPERCAFLRALFDHGEVREAEFPAAIPAIFGN